MNYFATVRPSRPVAERIVEESARYNIGGATRTINVPTLPLVFLHPRNQLRFSFVKGAIASAWCRVRPAGFGLLAPPMQTPKLTSLIVQDGGDWVAMSVEHYGTARLADGEPSNQG